jgi:hypothetical protein
VFMAQVNRVTFRMARGQKAVLLERRQHHHFQSIHADDISWPRRVNTLSASNS